MLLTRCKITGLTWALLLFLQSHTLPANVQVYEPGGKSTATPPQIQTYSAESNPAGNAAAPGSNTAVNSGVGGKSPFDFVVIDAGHGGKDGGATGYKGYLEKKMTLLVARRLKESISKQLPGLTVYMTRTSDRYVSLSGRTRKANRKYIHRDNGLFISIHGNTARNRKVYGYEVYYLSDDNKTEEARRLAAFENKHLIRPASNTEAMKMESAMLMAQIKKESFRLAGSVDRSLSRSLAKFTHTRGVKSANLHVLREALMPAILLEVGFISNRREAGLLKSDSYIRKMCDAIAAGVKTFTRTAPTQ